MQNNNLVRPSRFFSLEPIGIETPEVESISGYIKRLAVLHMVSVGVLICKEIIPAINASHKVKSIFLGNHNVLNAFFSHFSKDASNVLEQMTSVNGLTSIVPYIHKNYLSRKEVHRVNLAWCPICFEEGLKSGQVYEKLIWNFKDVEICKEHGVKLIQKCPNCNSSLKVLSWRSRVGYCDKCHCWLGSKNYKSIEPSEWDNWVYKNIEDLLFNSRNIDHMDDHQFQINLRNIIDLYNISCRRLGMLCGQNQAIVRNWLNGSKPTLHNLLHLSHKSGYTVLELLTKEINYPNKEFFDFLERTTNKRHINDFDLKALLNEVINSKGEMSLNKFCEENKINFHSIQRKFPIEAQIIIQNYETNMKSEKCQKINNIKRAIYNLLDRKVYPSLMAVNNELGYRIDVYNYNSARKIIQDEKKYNTREIKNQLPVWQMVKEAVISLDYKAISYADIKKYILEHYGTVNEDTITQAIIVCSVNLTNRIYYLKKCSIRSANGQYDLLYSLGRGLVTLYDPVKHGYWGIETANGKPVVKLLDDVVNPDLE